MSVRSMTEIEREMAERETELARIAGLLPDLEAAIAPLQEARDRTNEEYRAAVQLRAAIWPRHNTEHVYAETGLDHKGKVIAREAVNCTCVADEREAEALEAACRATAEDAAVALNEAGKRRDAARRGIGTLTALNASAAQEQERARPREVSQRSGLARLRERLGLAQSA